MTNLSVLERNTLQGLSEEAGGIYLRGSSRNEALAFRMACEWQDCIEPFLDALTSIPREVVEFIRERQFRRYFPDGRSAWPARVERDNPASVCHGNGAARR